MNVKTPISKEAALEALQQQSKALAAAATNHLEIPIKSCPGWFMVDLLVHIGAVHRAQAAIVRDRATEPAGIKREMFSSVPGLLAWLESSTLFGGSSNLETMPLGLENWFLEGAEELYEALADAEPTEKVWSWSDDKTIRHYLRMMPIETAVHRWDAENAVETASPIEAPLAVAGIGHTFEVMAPFRRSTLSAPPGQGESYHWTASNTDDTWSVRFVGSEVLCSRDSQEPAAVLVKGTASELFLFLWGRRPGSAVEVSGDASLLERYFQLVPPL